MDYLDDMRLKKEKVEHRHGVIANQKGGVIANFYNIYNRLCELFNCSWRTYVMPICSSKKFFFLTWNIIEKIF